MWLLVLLLAVSVLITAVVRRRGRDARDSVEEQRRRTDALRTATSGGSPLPDEMGNANGRPSRTIEPRRSLPITGRTALIAVAVVVAAIAIYAIAAGWGTSSTNNESSNDQPEKTTKSSTTTSSSSSTTTTTAPPVVAITSTEGQNVNITVPAGPFKLSITARQSCWMMVERADGTEVETVTLKEGDSREYEESGPLIVHLGNPGGVDVVINATPLTLPPSNGNAMELHITPAA